jgi:hypothetical protein
MFGRAVTRCVCFAASSGFFGRCWRFSGRVLGAIAARLGRPRCIRRLVAPRTAIGAIIGRLGQFRPATISRAATTTNRTGNERSAAIASPAGTRAETRQAIRPSSHKPVCAARGDPLTGSRLVQLGMAVRMKPGYGSHHEAKEHIVNVPRERVEPARQLDPCGEHGDPKHHRAADQIPAAKRTAGNRGSDSSANDDCRDVRRRCCVTTTRATAPHQADTASTTTPQWRWRFR